MFVRNCFFDIQADAESISTIASGRILVRDGRFVAIEQHGLPSPVSIAQVWWQARHRSLKGNECVVDYHVPRGSSAFITLDYVHSGVQTTYATLMAACHVLNEVARLRRASAIVAHVTNSRISDRVLARLGWERHLLSWRGRHFIRRFYDGYPEFSLGSGT